MYQVAWFTMSINKPLCCSHSSYVSPYISVYLAWPNIMTVNKCPCFVHSPRTLQLIIVHTVATHAQGQPKSHTHANPLNTSAFMNQLKTRFGLTRSFQLHSALTRELQRVTNFCHLIIWVDDTNKLNMALGNFICILYELLSFIICIINL